MRGSVDNQVKNITINSIMDCRGQSKHIAKEMVREAFRNEFRREPTWAETGKEMSIYSTSTLEAYQQVWANILNHARTEFKIYDAEKIDSNVVNSYLESKISDPENKIGKLTFRQYAAAAEKLETALNRYAANKNTGREYDFRNGIQGARDLAKTSDLKTHTESRAYENPQALINAIEIPIHQLVARIQLESGARIHEANNTSQHQLNGFKRDTLSRDQDKHQIQVRGKGGKIRNLNLSRATYNRVAKVIAETGKLHVNYHHYLDSLKDASEKTFHQYGHKGSHGLRHNYAKERFNEVRMVGDKSYEQALKIVSEEMGHVRGDITEHYLK